MKKNKIHVCIINPDYYRSSGVTRAIKRLHEGLINFGVEYIFVDCGLRDSESDSYFSAYKYQLMKPIKLSFWYDLWKFFYFLKKQKIDILHVHHRRLLLILWPISKLSRIPLVYTGHLVYSSQISKKFIKFDNGIAITDSVKEDMEHEFSFKKIDVISNAIDFPQRILNGQTKEKIVICVGRLDPVKNHALLLQAWNISKLQNYGWKLYLFGEGELELELKALAAKLGIAESVQFEGFKEDWMQRASTASFAVLPSHVEGQGLVTIEAATIGIPSLVSNVPGSKDCIPDNHNLPNLFSPNDENELANMLIEWAKDPEDLIKEANSIFEYTRSFAAKDIVAKKTYDIYRSMVSKSDKG